MKTFRTYQLAIQFCKPTRGLKLPSQLKDQFARASSSVALNLAEGSGKSSPKDRLRFYEYALGSIRECQAVMDIVGETCPALDEVAASTWCLCKSLRT